MEIVPESVGLASRAWDDQSLDLASAAELVSGAGTAGFTSAVSGAASRFLTQWQRHTATLGADAEANADGLRVTISDYVTSDEAVGADVLLLTAYVGEAR
jgi:predicted nicotinamide N-methyase